jgi:hypothetical protein
MPLMGERQGLARHVACEQRHKAVTKGQTYAMVDLVLLLETAQDAHGILNARL